MTASLLIIIIIISLYKFGLTSNSSLKSPRVFETLLNILADFNSAVILMVVIYYHYFTRCKFFTPTRLIGDL